MICVLFAKMYQVFSLKKTKTLKNTGKWEKILENGKKYWKSQGIMSVRESENHVIWYAPKKHRRQFLITAPKFSEVFVCPRAGGGGEEVGEGVRCYEGGAVEGSAVKWVGAMKFFRFLFRIPFVI